MTYISSSLIQVRVLLILNDVKLKCFVTVRLLFAGVNINGSCKTKKSDNSWQRIQRFELCRGFVKPLETLSPSATDHPMIKCVH